MKAMISQPMSGRTREEIESVRSEAAKRLNEMGYEVVNTFWPEKWASMNGCHPLAFVAKAIEKMADCDAVYFCKYWDDSRGCCLEHVAAWLYGLKVIYEGVSDEQ